ncbi:elongation factor 1-delta-like protein [Cinnamomum micranthum f. kanehirae]|uniref:Elongation factor 1-delta-like protein n=1 Tax=Cinnamomum micranthum f. kanehirae TaxID=337451 RepID=A0A443PVY4_9MAGN|nr:elongation factor 1-delta-like protein [Cinnamomum micranthum f. kanehirae]
MKKKKKRRRVEIPAIYAAGEPKEEKRRLMVKVDFVISTGSILAACLLFGSCPVSSCLLGNLLKIVLAMAVTLSSLNSESGLKKLNDYLLTRSYISGYQASKDDITVYAAFPKAPSADYVNVCRWYHHIDALIRISGVSGEGAGVTISGSAPCVDAPSSPPATDAKAPAADDDDDDDVDLFGEETEEEKKAAEERAAAIKASGKKKESGKSSVLLDVKPWDDETDMQKLEETVRNIQMDGLLWGASKLVAVGYGIKKLQIMMTIVDDLVSVDTLIEEHLTVEPANEYIQSCDIVAFNKICVSLSHPQRCINLAPPLRSQEYLSSLLCLSRIISPFSFLFFSLLPMSMTKYLLSRCINQYTSLASNRFAKGRDETFLSSLQ